MFVPRLTGDVISLYLSAPYLWCCNYNKLRRKLSNMHGKCGSCIPLVYVVTLFEMHKFWPAETWKRNRYFYFRLLLRQCWVEPTSKVKQWDSQKGNSSFRIRTISMGKRQKSLYGCGKELLILFEKAKALYSCICYCSLGNRTWNFH